jgi:hypothetical protein
LIFRSGPQKGSAIALGPGLNRIGRNPANNIQIEEPSISGFHCEMHVSSLGVAFRDVGSSNGSFIEGRRIEKEIISSAKTIRLGAIDFDLNVPTANVAVPQKQKEQEVRANFMPDGTQACQTHAGIAAHFLCAKCERTWCNECVRRTGLVGSANATFSCTQCGARCEKIAVTIRRQKKSLFNQISNTLRKFRN